MSSNSDETAESIGNENVDFGSAEDVVESYDDELAEQQRKQAEAIRQKERIRQAKTTVDEDADPVSVSAPDDEVFEFRPLPEATRNWVMNTVVDLVGFDMEELQDNPDEGRKLGTVNNRLAEILEEQDTTGVYDADWWKDCYGLEDRMMLVEGIAEAQERREGNRR